MPVLTLMCKRNKGCDTSIESAHQAELIDDVRESTGVEISEEMKKCNVKLGKNLWQ